MKKYLVIKQFKDLQDDGYKYGVGDEFPRPGLKVSKQRLEELSTNKNRRGVPVLEIIDEPEVENEVTAKDEIVPEIPEKGTEESTVDEGTTVEEVKPKRTRKKKNAD